jgi:hypothetical protein
VARKQIPIPTVGEWVEAYSPGVWQVLKTLSGFYEIRNSLEEPKRISRRTLIFAKRLVDDTWRKAFRVEVYGADLAHPLTAEQRARLDDYLTSHPDVAAEFEAYQPQVPGLIHSVGFNLPHVPDFEERRALVNSVFNGIERGFTKDEILERIARSPLAPYVAVAPTNTTVRFGNIAHELRDGDFVFRAFDVQSF